MAVLRYFVCSLLLVALLAPISVSAEVLDLNDENFDKTIEDPSKVFFIKFFAPWCGHCKRLAPAWDELGSEELLDGVVIARVDCTLAKDVCTKQEIKGYPTLKVLYKGEDYKKYQGQRDLGSLRTFIQTVASETVTVEA